MFIFKRVILFSRKSKSKRIAVTRAGVHPSIDERDGGPFTGRHEEGFFFVKREFSKCFTSDGIAIDAASSQRNTPGGGFSCARDLKTIFSFVIIAAAAAFITGCLPLPRIARKPIHHTQR